MDLNILEDDLDYSPDSIKTIVNIQNKILKNKSKMSCLKLNSHYICPALFPLIFSLPYAGKLVGKIIAVNHKKTNDSLSKDVILYGVDAHFKINNKELSENVVVPFCLAPELDDNVAENIEAIVNNIPVKLEENYKMAITSQITEVFNNSYEHGINKIGSFFNSYYDEKERSFRFTVYDLGNGFKQAIKNYLKVEKSNDCIIDNWQTSDFIEWALLRGNTTQPKDYPRGVGYDVLQQFAIENNGEIILCTNDSICHITSLGKSYISLENEIKGTFFTMRINLDNTHIYKV